jgi:hypothetical protein
LDTEDGLGHLTGTKHGDAINALLKFYQDEAEKLEASGSYFMAAVALGAALETALLAYMLVEWADDNGGELQIPDDIGLDDLIKKAKSFELLDAVKFQEATGTPARSVEHVIQEIQWMRNNLHPAKALRKSFDPASFDANQYRKIRGIYGAVLDNLLHYL